MRTTPQTGFTDFRADGQSLAARGDFRPDSDYDIAVFIRDPEGWLDEVIRLASLGTSILLDTGAVISAKPFRAGAYNGNGALMRAIRGEGLDL